jgi:putative peptidoglycan lipid II flippase
MLTIVALGGLAFIALGIFLAPAIVGLLAPGFHSSPDKFALTVSLTRWLLPFIVFISLAAVVMGFLNAHQRFGPPAFAPVALNLCIILSAVAIVPFFGNTPEKQVYGWTIGVLLGGLAQWLVQIPAARGLGFRFAPRLRHPGVGEVGRLMAPALAGYSVAQVHLLVNTILASLLAEGSVAYLYYGNRLMQLPLGVFGVALSTVALPLVAQAFAGGSPARASKPLNHALALTAFTVLPASAGLIALAGPINGLLFRFGRFDSADALVTSAVSIAYAVGIIGHALTRVLTPAFYAAGRPSIPVRVAMVSVVANALLSIALMMRLGVVGLPLSTSIVALASAGWLGWKLRPVVPGLGGGKMFSSFGRSLFASVLMGGFVWIGAVRAEVWLAVAGIGGKLNEAVVTGGGMAVGFLLFVLLAWVLKIPELHDFMDIIKRRVVKR